MKKSSDVCRDYVRRLNNDDLELLDLRLSQRLGGDMGNAVETIQKSEDMDDWLTTASSANDFYDMIDLVASAAQAEYKRRKGNK